MACPCVPSQLPPLTKTSEQQQQQRKKTSPKQPAGSEKEAASSEQNKQAQERDGLATITEEKTKEQALRKKSGIITRVSSEIDIVAAVNTPPHRSEGAKRRPQSAEARCLPSLTMPALTTENDGAKDKGPALQEKSVTLPQLKPRSNDSSIHGNMTSRRSSKNPTRRISQIKTKKNRALRAKILEQKLKNFYQRVELLSPRREGDSGQAVSLPPQVVEAS